VTGNGVGRTFRWLSGPGNMTASEAQPASPPRNRRWLQFSLRTLIGIVLLASVWMSWVAVRIQRAEKQKVAVQAIERLGGGVTYDYQLASGQFVPSAKPPGPTWTRSLLGEEFFAQVLAVGYYGPQVTDAWLEPVTKLPQLRELWLTETRVTDRGLEQLKGFSQLKLLRLDGAPQVTDVGLEHVKGLAQLQCLSLLGTQVTDSGLERLTGFGQLTHLSLSGTRVTDAGLEFLKGLPQLEGLSLDGTYVTDAGLKHLKGLPQLRMLALDSTQATDVGLKHLKGLSQLDMLYLYSSRVTTARLEHLQSLTQLRELWVFDTPVSDEDVESLQRALPGCNIHIRR
jgi:Leucine-rich repeat (LRR) protein